MPTSHTGTMAVWLGAVTIVTVAARLPVILPYWSIPEDNYWIFQKYLFSVKLSLCLGSLFRFFKKKTFDNKSTHRSLIWSTSWRKCSGQDIDKSDHILFSKKENPWPSPEKLSVELRKPLPTPILGFIEKHMVEKYAHIWDTKDTGSPAGEKAKLWINPHFQTCRAFHPDEHNQQSAPIQILIHKEKYFAFKNFITIFSYVCLQIIQKLHLLVHSLFEVQMNWIIEKWSFSLRVLNIKDW